MAEYQTTMRCEGGRPHAAASDEVMMKLRFGHTAAVVAMLRQTWVMAFIPLHIQHHAIKTMHACDGLSLAEFGRTTLIESLDESLYPCVMTRIKVDRGQSHRSTRERNQVRGHGGRQKRLFKVLTHAWLPRDVNPQLTSSQVAPPPRLDAVPSGLARILCNTSTPLGLLILVVRYVLRRN